MPGVVYTASFTGTDGADWGSDWTFMSGDVSGTTSRSIQSNAGQQQATAAGYRNDMLTALGNVADFDVTVKVDPGTTSGSTGNQPAFFFRADSALTTLTGYYLEMTFLDATYGRLRFMTAPAYSGLGDYLFTHGGAGSTYWLRVQMIGQALKTKIWNTNASEPGTWAQELTNGTHTTGRFGFTLFAPEITRTVRWDDLAITDVNSDAYAAAVMADRPVAYWRLGEASGTVAASVTGAHAGTYTNGPTLAQSGILSGNTAVTFDGTDDRIVVPHHANLGGANGYSVEAWVMPTDRATQRQIMSKGQYNTGWRVRVETNGTLWAISPQDGGAADLRVHTSTGTVPVDSAWHHVVVTYTPAAGRTDFYIDGVAAGSQSTANTGTVLQNTEDVKIGSLADVVVSNNEMFKGGLDELAFYSSPLTLTQVQAHYAARPSATPTVIERPTSTIAAGGWTGGHANLGDNSDATVITGTGV